MDGVFIGSEARASGTVTGYQLRAHHRRLLPDVWAPRHRKLTHADRATAAWLWTRREGVVAGPAASALHGARWVDQCTPIELIWPNHRAPAGVITYNDTLLPGETQVLSGVPATTAIRTAFDLARRGPVGIAVERLDALARATDFRISGVLALLQAHPHTRGIKRIPDVLDLVDPGAQSPKETWLRLLLIDEGFPRPQTQIPVPGPDGHPRYFLDMGWPDEMVAVEYDGEQHRLDRDIYRADLIRSEYIAWMGWRRVRVIAGDRRHDIVRRVRQARAR